jgi:hypothetical protein
MRILLFSFILFAAFNAALPAFAQQALRFRDADGYRESQILVFLNERRGSETAFLLAPVDLNDDLISEYIARDPECPPSALCPFYIVAMMEREPTLIGQISAHKITPADKKDYGVRQLLVYNQSGNDFAGEPARWNPWNFRYEVWEDKLDTIFGSN